VYDAFAPHEQAGRVVSSAGYSDICSPLIFERTENPVIALEEQNVTIADAKHVAIA